MQFESKTLRLAQRYAYPVAVGLSLLTLALRIAAHVPFPNRQLMILFMVPVTLSAYLGGLGPGLLATAITAVGCLYFGIEPVHSITVTRGLDAFLLIVFIAVATITSVICEMLHRARRKAEESQRRLMDSETQHRLALDAARIGIWDHDLTTNAITLDARAQELLELGPSVAFSEILKSIHPEDLPRVRQTRNDGLDPTSKGESSQEFRYRRNGGEMRWLVTSGRAQFSTKEPRHPIRSKGIILDVTKEKSLEEAVQTSRRLEALGRLSGGISHDFNNLLTVISGNLQLIASDPTSPRVADFIAAAQRAADVGAALTQRLVTFARKQAASPVETDLNAALLSMRDALVRAIGETHALEFDLQQDLWKSKINPSEFESGVINLALNAKDAMPESGTLYISTRNVSASNGMALDSHFPSQAGLVRLIVRDSGEGMPASVLARAFEPFFTTKHDCRGSGLGLATLHEFVAQSGGKVVIDSAPGRGTTVTIDLPAVGPN